MPTTRRSRTVAAPPGRVWRVVGDPHHLPRWWPNVERVEAVDRRGFTQVMRTAKGRTVRADFRVLETTAPARHRWVQEIEGTPFEGFLAQAETAVEVEPDGDGSRVTITARQKLRGMSRVGGGFLLKRATRRRLDEALDGLESVL